MKVLKVRSLNNEKYNLISQELLNIIYNKEFFKDGILVENPIDNYNKLIINDDEIVDLSTDVIIGFLNLKTTINKSSEERKMIFHYFVENWNKIKDNSLILTISKNNYGIRKSNNIVGDIFRKVKCGNRSVKTTSLFLEENSYEFINTLFIDSDDITNFEYGLTTVNIFEYSNINSKINYHPDMIRLSFMFKDHFHLMFYYCKNSYNTKYHNEILDDLLNKKLITDFCSNKSNDKSNKKIRVQEYYVNNNNLWYKELIYLRKKIPFDDRSINRCFITGTPLYNSCKVVTIKSKKILVSDSFTNAALLILFKKYKFKIEDISLLELSIDIYTIVDLLVDKDIRDLIYNNILGCLYYCTNQIKGMQKKILKYLNVKEKSLKKFSIESVYNNNVLLYGLYDDLAINETIHDLIISKSI